MPATNEPREPRFGAKRPTVVWGYRPDSTVQENPYPKGSALYEHWEMTKMEHDIKRVNGGN